MMNGTRQDRRRAHFERIVQRDMKTIPKRRGVTWRSGGQGGGFSASGLPLVVLTDRDHGYVGFVCGYKVATGKARGVADKCLDYWATRPDLHKWWELRQKEQQRAKHSGTRGER